VNRRQQAQRTRSFRPCQHYYAAGLGDEIVDAGNGDICREVVGFLACFCWNDCYAGSNERRS
jgi:hypothetical protein